MEKYLYKGKTEEKILEQALAELELTENDIFYKATEEKGGLLKGKKVVLEIVKVNDVSALGREILKEIIDGLDIDHKIEVKVREHLISYEIFSNNNSMLIGKKGRILDSIQTYLKQAIYNRININANIVVDVENYKSKQQYFLTRDVKKIAREVTLSKVSVKLDPMNSFERRLVHSALQKFDYIETESEGEEPNRCIVIKYKEKNKE